MAGKLPDRGDLPGGVQSSSPNGHASFERTEPVNEAVIRVPPELTKSPVKQPKKSKSNGANGAAARLRERSGGGEEVRLRPVPKKMLRTTAHAKSLQASHGTSTTDVDSAVDVSNRHLEEDSSQDSDSDSQEDIAKSFEPAQQSAAPAQKPEPTAPSRQDSQRQQQAARKEVQHEVALPSPEEIKEFCLSTGGGYGVVDRDRGEFGLGEAQVKREQRSRTLAGKIGELLRGGMRRMSTASWTDPSLRRAKSHALPPREEESDFAVVVVRFRCRMRAAPAHAAVSVALTGVDPSVQIKAGEPGALLWKRVTLPGPTQPRFPSARSTLAPDFSRSEGEGAKLTREEEEYGPERARVTLTKHEQKIWLKVESGLDEELGRERRNSAKMQHPPTQSA